MSADDFPLEHRINDQPYRVPRTHPICWITGCGVRTTHATGLCDEHLEQMKENSQ